MEEEGYPHDKAVMYSAPSRPPLIHSSGIMIKRSHPLVNEGWKFPIYTPVAEEGAVLKEKQPETNLENRV